MERVSILKVYNKGEVNINEMIFTWLGQGVNEKPNVTT